VTARQIMNATNTTVTTGPIASPKLPDLRASATSPIAIAATKARIAIGTTGRLRGSTLLGGLIGNRVDRPGVAAAGG
jgi:hypothetical protein